MIHETLRFVKQVFAQVPSMGILLGLVMCNILMMSCARENVFEEPLDYPVIDSIKPAYGGIGTQLRLYGKGFSPNTLENTVSINGMNLRVETPSSTVAMIATILDNTGTGPVRIAVNDRASDGPIFTFLQDGGAPVITAVMQGWDDGRGYSIDVTGISSVDSEIKLFVNGTEVQFDYVTRPGHIYYREELGTQLLIKDPAIIEDHIPINWADIVVTVRGVASNTLRYYVRPLITEVESKFGPYVIAGLELVTIRGDFFGEGSASSKIIIFRESEPPPQIISWANTEIVVKANEYREAIIDQSISVTVVVDNTWSYGAYCMYIGAVNATAVLVAGSDEGYEDGPAAIARFNRPFGVAVDTDQSIFITEESNHAVRRISPGGIVSTFAGGTVGRQAQFNGPRGIVATGFESFYVADAGNNRIRVVFEDAEVRTVAGNGSGSEFWYPSGVAYSHGEEIVVADMNNHRIKIIGPEGAAIETIGGLGEGFADGSISAAKFSSPYGVAITRPGTLGDLPFIPTIYVADRGNRRIRKIHRGQVETFAGSGASGTIDGIGTAATFESPTGLALDTQGNLYVADFGSARIRKITPQGVVSTITPEFPNNGGLALFYGPTGIAIDAQGNLVVADNAAHKIYRITLK